MSNAVFGWSFRVQKRSPRSFDFFIWESFTLLPADNMRKGNCAPALFKENVNSRSCSPAPQSVLKLAYCWMKTAPPALGKLSGDSYSWMWPGGGSIAQLLRPLGWAALLRAEAGDPGVLDLSALLFLTWRQEGALLPGTWFCPFFSWDGKYAKCPLLQLIKFNWRGACGDDLG